MSRTFKHDHKVYHGFNRSFDPAPAFVAIVREEDCVNVWALDGDKTDELQRYYKSLGLPHLPIGVYALWDRILQPAS